VARENLMFIHSTKCAPFFVITCGMVPLLESEWTFSRTPASRKSRVLAHVKGVAQRGKPQVERPYYMVSVAQAPRL